MKLEGFYVSYEHFKNCLLSYTRKTCKKLNHDEKTYMQLVQTYYIIIFLWKDVVTCLIILYNSLTITVWLGSYVVVGRKDSRRLSFEKQKYYNIVICIYCC